MIFAWTLLGRFFLPNRVLTGTLSQNPWDTFGTLFLTVIVKKSSFDCTLSSNPWDTFGTLWTLFAFWTESGPNLLEGL